MLSLDVIIVMGALAYFFWRASEEDLEAQRRAAGEAQDQRALAAR